LYTEGSDPGFNHHHNIAHLDDVTWLETDVRHATGYRCKKSALHFHGLHDGDHSFFRNDVAGIDCQSQQLAWHKSANFTRTSSGFGLSPGRLRGPLEKVGAAVKPYRR
jgi:hypothetical protein